MKERFIGISLTIRMSRTFLKFMSLTINLSIKKKVVLSRKSCQVTIQNLLMEKYLHEVCQIPRILSPRDNFGKFSSHRESSCLGGNA